MAYSYPEFKEATSNIPASYDLIVAITEKSIRYDKQIEDQYEENVKRGSAEYAFRLLSYISDVIDRKFVTDSVFTKGYAETYLTNPSILDESVSWTDSEGRDVGIKALDMHYGVSRSNHFKDRDVGIWDDIDVERPFKKVQSILLEKGYYLLDISDPAKSMRIVWWLATSIDYEQDEFVKQKFEEYMSKELWHNLNEQRYNFVQIGRDNIIVDYDYSPQTPTESLSISGNFDSNEDEYYSS